MSGTREDAADSRWRVGLHTTGRLHQGRHVRRAVTQSALRSQRSPSIPAHHSSGTDSDQQKPGRGPALSAAGRIPEMREAGGAELREFWVAAVRAKGGMTSHDLFVALRDAGMQPKGADYKGRIRNIHAAASHEPRLSKVRPGVFDLAPDNRIQ